MKTGRWILFGIFAVSHVCFAADQPGPPPQPPVKVRIPAAEWNYGKEQFVLRGVAIVRDEYNKETLYLGGHNGGAPFGWIGHWALAEDGTTWREMRFASALLDPLRKKAEEARVPAKLAEAAARNIYYKALTSDQEQQAVKGEVMQLTREAIRLVDELIRSLSDARAHDWEREAVERARVLVGKAGENLKSAAEGFAAGKLTADLIKNCFIAQWSLDEAAGCLASFPGPREGASAVYVPQKTVVVFFGGSHHDYMTNETWIYDCRTKSWRQVWPQTAPTPRMNATLIWSEEKKQLVLSGGETVLNKMVYQKGSMPAPPGDWFFDIEKCEWAGEGGMSGGSRIYRTIVPAYDPCWYDAAPRGDPLATAEWLAKLEPNTWTEVPRQPAPAPERDWGTAVFDPDRDQIYRWTGGHCA
ncbi:MAG: kelch motif-containing protein, partial [Kiritimatiellae bacterium]|nr:kelch motif-containing protein [Kiritimatiellia bacterium]